MGLPVAFTQALRPCQNRWLSRICHNALSQRNQTQSTKSVDVDHHQLIWLKRRSVEAPTHIPIWMSPADQMQGTHTLKPLDSLGHLQADFCNACNPRRTSFKACLGCDACTMPIAGVCRSWLARPSRGGLALRSRPSRHHPMG